MVGEGAGALGRTIVPHYDKHTGDVIVRVVYDGPPEAGKTTNIRLLHDSLSLTGRARLASPGTSGRRTEFFDWLDFRGGFVEGRRMRCQLVSVPGQADLLRRRQYLLETADAVVFVADAHPLLVAENREAFEQLLAMLQRVEGGAPIGVVLQANKQDREGALSPAALRRALEAGPEVPVIAARAHEGAGVRETFLLTVRLAVERAKTEVLHGVLEEASAGYESPELLYELMRSEELPAAGAEDADSRRADPRAPSSPDTPAHRDPSLDRKALPPVSATTRPVAPSAQPPKASDIPSGCSWPPVTGRSVVAAFEHGDITTRSVPRSWAPAGVRELVSDDLVAHTHPDWAYADAEVARLALVRVVHRALRDRGHVPAARTFVMAPETDFFRLWVLSPDLPTAADRLAEALSRRDEEATATCLRQVVRAVVSVPGTGRGLDAIAHDGNGPVVLALADPTASGARESVAPSSSESESGASDEGLQADLVRRVRAASEDSATRAHLRVVLARLEAETSPGVDAESAGDLRDQSRDVEGRLLRQLSESVGGVAS